jgi:hypothetical protein
VERKARYFLGHKLWVRGYFVSTIGRNKEMTCAYKPPALLGVIDSRAARKAKPSHSAIWAAM